MSVWISAIFGHRWPTLTKATVDQIARASSGEASRTGYKRIYDPRSKCRQIANDDSDAFLLPGDFSVHFGRQIFELGQPVRWGRLLLYKKVRRHFFAACRRTAKVAGAAEVLILPEGTQLADCLYEDVSFEDVKRRALAIWGPPDLKPSTFFTKKELAEMPRNRVHDFLLPLSNCSPEQAH